MLGAETLRGLHPVLTVETVAKLCHAAERHFDYRCGATAAGAEAAGAVCVFCWGWDFGCCCCCGGLLLRPPLPAAGGAAAGAWHVAGPGADGRGLRALPLPPLKALLLGRPSRPPAQRRTHHEALMGEAYEEEVGMEGTNHSVTGACTGSGTLQAVGSSGRADLSLPTNHARVRMVSGAHPLGSCSARAPLPAPARPPPGAADFGMFQSQLRPAGGSSSGLEHSVHTIHNCASLGAPAGARSRRSALESVQPALWRIAVQAGHQPMHGGAVLMCPLRTPAPRAGTAWPPRMWTATKPTGGCLQRAPPPAPPPRRCGRRACSWAGAHACMQQQSLVLSGLAEPGWLRHPCTHPLGAARLCHTCCTHLALCCTHPPLPLPSPQPYVSEFGSLLPRRANSSHHLDRILLTHAPYMTKLESLASSATRCAAGGTAAAGAGWEAGQLAGPLPGAGVRATAGLWLGGGGGLRSHPVTLLCAPLWLQDGGEDQRRSHHCDGAERVRRRWGRGSLERRRRGPAGLPPALHGETACRLQAMPRPCHAAPRRAAPCPPPRRRTVSLVAKYRPPMPIMVRLRL